MYSVDKIIKWQFVSIRYCRHIGIVQGELIWLNIVIYYNYWKVKLILIAVGTVQGKFVMFTISIH